MIQREKNVHTQGICKTFGVVENAVAQQLRANGDKLRFYSVCNDSNKEETIDIAFTYKFSSQAGLAQLKKREIIKEQRSS